LNDGNKDEFKKLENGCDLSNVISFSKDGHGGRDEDVVDLQNPAAQEAKHADGVDLVSLLDDGRSHDVDGDGVVVVVEVHEEGDVAEQFHDGERDAEREGEQHQGLLMGVHRLSGSLKI